jgi:DNA helicase-2/ATP-dependent DNA helicase PcrA
MGYKFHLKKDLKNSLNEILKPLKRVSGKKVLKLDLRKIAIDIIYSLKNDEILNKTILEFYLELRQKISDTYSFDIGSAFRAGHAKTFYDSHTMKDMLPYIKVDTRSEDLVRTIHSAKGTEFENTLVHFESTAEFRNYIINSNNHINSDEDDCRVYYVGCSRAMVSLYINIPEATQADLVLIEGMNLLYERI